MRPAGLRKTPNVPWNSSASASQGGSRPVKAMTRSRLSGLARVRSNEHMQEIGFRNEAVADLFTLDRRLDVIRIGDETDIAIWVS